MFPLPMKIFSFLMSGSSMGTFVTWAFYIIFAFWVLYTLVAIYHWLKYSHASLIAIPSIIVHLAISFALISYALFGNASFLSSILP